MFERMLFALRCKLVFASCASLPVLLAEAAPAAAATGSNGISSVSVAVVVAGAVVAAFVLKKFMG